MLQQRPSVASRIADYYRRNPGEELTFAMLAEKFGCTLKRARKAVYELADEGQLESVHVVRRRERGSYSEQQHV